MAALLAIASVGGEDTMKEMINANIRASDTWAFYQSKNIRQLTNRVAADELESLMVMHAATLDDATRQALQPKIDRYRATADRYESEPDPNDPTNPLKGEGKRELTAQAQNWEKIRDHAEAKDRSFDYSRALYQIALVLGSVAIVSVSRPVLGLSLLLGVVATLLAANGFFAFVDLTGAAGGVH